MRVKDVDRFPSIIVGNKSDLASEIVVTDDMINALVSRLGCKFFKTSAKKRVNVDESFHELVREIRAYNRQSSAPAVVGGRAGQAGAPNDGSGTHKSGCCAGCVIL